MIKFGNLSKNTGSSISSLTVSHQTLNNPDRMLLVAVHGADAVGANAVVTSVKYNGVNLTYITATARGGGGVQVRTEFWYLLNPPVGTYNVVITTTGSIAGLGGVAYGLNNAMQIAPQASALANANGVTTITTSLTTVGGNNLVIDATTINVTTGITQDGSQTSQYNDALSNARMGGSYKEVASGSSVSMIETFATARVASISVSLVGKHEVNVLRNLTVAEFKSILVNPLVPFAIQSISVNEF